MLGLSLGIPFRPYDRSAIQQMLDALRRNNGSLWYAPDNALGDGAPNLLSAPEFAAGLADAPTRTGLVTLSSIAGYDNALAFGHDGSTLTLAYKSFTPVVGLTYTVSATVKMDDGLAPTFASPPSTSNANTFAFVVANDPYLPTIVAANSDGTYRVSATVVAPSTLSGLGVIKYAANNNRTFKVTGYKLELGSVATAYTPQAVLRQRGVYVDNAGTTPVTAVGDLIGLITDKIGTRSTVVFTAITAWTQGGAFGNFSGSTASGDTITALAANGARYIRFPVLPGQFVDYSATITAGTSAGAIVLSWGTSAAGYISAVASPDTSSGPVRLSGTAPSNAAFVEFCIRAATSGGTTTFTNISAGITPGNHATQSAVASKPSVQRVPKRTKGPVNQLLWSQWGGGGTAPTGWLAFGGGGTEGALLPSGMRQRVFTSTASRDFIYSSVNLAANTVYTVAVYVDANPNNAIASNILYQGALPVGAGMVVADTVPAAGSFIVGTITTGANAGTVTLRIGLGTSNVVTGSVTLSAPAVFQGTYTAQQIIDNGGIPLTTTQPLPNVLEWANVISFDGSNDFLQTGITTGNEGFVAAGVTFTTNPDAYEAIFYSGSSDTAQKSVYLVKGTQGWNGKKIALAISDGTTRYIIHSPQTITAGVPVVVDCGWKSTQRFVSVNGHETVETGTNTYGPSAGTAQIGGVFSTNVLNGPMHAIAYTPVLPSAADRATIRNGIAALQGRVL